MTRSARNHAKAPKGRRSIVVAGEFNAGKTSVINLMLRRELQPASVDYSMMPPTRIVPSDKDVCTITKLDGSPGDLAAFQAGKLKGKDLRSVEIGTDLGELSEATITEVSVGLNGELSAEGRKVLENADLLIWCTMGQRAWALTEISVVSALPAAVRRNAILVVTRADYLRDEESRGLVQRRLNKQAREFFSTILQVAASRKAIDDCTEDASWIENGGKALRKAALKALVANAEPPSAGELAEPAPAAAADAASAIEVPAARPKAKHEEATVEAASAPPAPDRGHAGEDDIWAVEFDEFTSWLSEPDTAHGPNDVVHRLNAMMHRIAPAGSASSRSSAEMHGLSDHVDFVREHLGKTLQKQVSDEDALRCVDLVLQLEEELVIWRGGLKSGVYAGIANEDQCRVS